MLSQYEFRKVIVLDWFGLQTEDGTSAIMSENCKKQKSDYSNMQYSLSSEEQNSSKRATRMRVEALDPIDGALWLRLDENIEHYPVLSKVKHPCCSLYRLASSNKNHRVYHHVYS
jgi:hypothetical protein